MGHRAHNFVKQRWAALPVHYDQARRYADGSRLDVHFYPSGLKCDIEHIERTFRHGER